MKEADPLAQPCDETEYVALPEAEGSPTILPELVTDENTGSDDRVSDAFGTAVKVPEEACEGSTEKVELTDGFEGSEAAAVVVENTGGCEEIEPGTSTSEGAALSVCEEDGGGGTNVELAGKNSEDDSTAATVVALGPKLSNVLLEAIPAGAAATLEKLS